MIYLKEDAMIKTRPFMSGRSQAIRLPKEYRFGEGENYINKIDGVLMVTEKEHLWDVFEASLDKFTDDFMSDRGADVKDDRDQ
jgi:antitoxin VapB